MLKKIIYIIISFIGFSGIILIHELGHFSFGKFFDIPISTFSIGFGPTLLKVKSGETNFRLAALPLGGYVQFAQKPEIYYFDDFYSFLQSSSNNKYFNQRPYYQKILVLLGGILFNIISGIIFLIFAIYLYKTDKLNLTNEEIENKSKLKLMLLNLREVLSKTKNKNNFQGPIGIFNFLLISAYSSFSIFLFLLAILSFNLAIFNLLPVPLLDGGQITILTIEKIIGHAIPSSILYILNLISIVLFSIFFFYITSKDIRSLF